jgi:hypothetical protein
MESSRVRSASAACLFVLLAAACDKRTPEEKGKDYAEEKLGFVEGASKVLEDKGKGIGQSVGKGVGDVVKGTGSGVKDVIQSPVKVELGADLGSTGVKIMQAHEGDQKNDTRGVVVYLDFPQAFAGRLRLHAVGADKADIGRADLADNLTQAAGSQQNFTFPFPGDMRLSKVDHYVLHMTPPKSVSADATLIQAGLSLSQLKEQGSDVSIYIVFADAYTGGLQLRAKTADGQEIGRSEATEKLKQVADSAGFFTFKFDARAPLATATQYSLHSATPKKP